MHFCKGTKSSLLHSQLALKGKFIRWEQDSKSPGNFSTSLLRRKSSVTGSPKLATEWKVGANSPGEPRAARGREGPGWGQDLQSPSLV